MNPSGAKEAAEKGMIEGKNPEKHPAGAKAQHLSCSTCGTTEVVPCYKTSQLLSFSGACEVRVDSAALMYGLKPVPFTETSFFAGCKALAYRPALFAAARSFTACLVAVVLLQANLAMAAEPASAAASVQTPAPLTTGGQRTQSNIPFEQLVRPSRNPIDAYRGKTVPPPSMANSARLTALMRDGKIYLSLRDAIDLALENNLDMVIARYNLPIAQMDILRTQAGGQVRGVNTGVVQGTPGGGAGGAGAGTGAGGTSSGAGGAGAGASGIVSSTLGTGTSVSGYDPYINAQVYSDHTSQQLTNQTLYGVPVYKLNTNQFNVSYDQSFPTGTSLEVDWDNNRTTSNSSNNGLNPQLYASMRVLFQQQLLAGFGTGPNLRFLRIARTNQKISDIAFRAQVIATVTQICDLYWDLVSAYDNEQVGERSVAFATETLSTGRKQLELQAIPEMEVLKAEGELATREQDLTVARTNLELQELYMKNAITRSLDDPILEEMAVMPVDAIGSRIEPVSEPVQEMIAAALKNRTELAESSLDLENRELSRKTARNALLPSLGLYGFYEGTGYGGTANPCVSSSTSQCAKIVAPGGYGGTLENALNYSSPEYQVGFQLSIPLRNRIAKADQARTELEYRQSQVYAEELKKRICIEVRNARYALEQGVSRVQAARKARDLAQRTLDIMQKEQKLGAGSNQQTLSAEHDLAVAESALVTAETAYEKARIEVRRSTGSVLEEYGISIADAKAGAVEASHLQ
jgi:outer membrane protein TolC